VADARRPPPGRDVVTARLRAVVARLDRLQQRRRALGLPIAVFKRFGEHGGGRLASNISYYGFFSLFPLLLAFVTVVGMLVADDDDLREDLIDGAFGQIPVIGDQLAVNELPGSGLVLAIGLVTAIWAGLGAVNALQFAFDTIADVPVRDRGNGIVRRLRSLLFLVLLAVGIVVSTLTASLTAVVAGGLLGAVLALLASLVVNGLLMAMMFTVLPAQRVGWRSSLPGIVLGAVGLVVLQQLGGLVVRHWVAGASATYGTFAIVIALLSWFILVSRVILLSAELNHVLALDLTPRRLDTEGEPTDADRRAAMLDVQRIQRDNRLGYALSVEGHVATDAEPLGTTEPVVDEAAEDQPATSR
jgi:YihY family inner membrane protein